MLTLKASRFNMKVSKTSTQLGLLIIFLRTVALRGQMQSNLRKAANTKMPQKHTKHVGRVSGDMIK